MSREWTVYEASKALNQPESTIRRWIRLLELDVERGKHSAVKLTNEQFEELAAHSRLGKQEKSKLYWAGRTAQPV